MENKLLDIESDKKILEYRNADGDPIWMYMRYAVLYDYLTPLFLNASIVHTSRSNGLNAFKYLAKATISNIKHKFIGLEEFDILFYTISRGLTFEDGFFNQYTDYFWQVDVDNCLTVEHSPLDWNWYKKRVNNNVIYNGPNLALVTKFSTCSKEEEKTVSDLMEYIRNRANQVLNVEFTEDECEQIIQYTIREMVRMRKHALWILKLAKKTNSKLVVISGGTYSRYYPINKILKENGIKTADLQHGYITSSNIVYNYSPAIIECKDIIDASPDYFFSYGEWWNSQTNIPFIKKIVIGNPHREQLKKNYNFACEKTKILLIGCARNTAEYIKMATFLSENIDTYEIYFRPHPSERYETERILLEGVNIKVDFDPNLYKSLESASFIVSEISTVLFEAIGLVPNIIMWRTNYSKFILEKSPFISFETQEELLGLISKEKQDNTELSEFIFWDENWKENYFKLANLY